ncbi:VOC family protein [Thalassobacillus hwangdonensis]|uniref:VOC family protein n=1 Tax=Thalassobacillus hwangdonensis TaxID=546108 RepID=A0ABW3L4G5_9BACI
MSKSPIKNKVSTVFIPVKDIGKAKQWYTKMLDVQNGEEMFDHLFIAEMDGTGMVLDKMPMWKNEQGEVQPLNVPAIQFATEDIHASYQFMKTNDVELVTEVEHDKYFVFKDPDGNLLMVCQE